MMRLEERLIQLHRSRLRRRLQRSGVGLLALCLLLTTLAALQVPAYTQRKAVFCGLQEHVHTRACFEGADAAAPACGLQEHVHTAACFSDPGADLEDEALWMQTFPRDLGNTSPNRRVVLLARSQLGYSESQRNYRVSGDDQVSGRTRYGDWAGDPYQPWNGAFAAFCYHYAGISQARFPRDPSPERWRSLLRGRSLYEDHSTSSYLPQPGELVFYAGEDAALCVGIVSRTDTPKGTVHAICGDTAHQVRQLCFEVTEARLLGFGRLPEGLFSSAGSAAAAELPAAAEPVPETERPQETIEAPTAAPEQPTEAAEEFPPSDPSGADARTQATEEPQVPETETAHPPGAAESIQALEPPEAESPDSPGAAEPPQGDAGGAVVLTAQVGDYQISVQLTDPPEGSCRLRATPVPVTRERVRQVEESQSETLPNGISRRAQVRQRDLLLFDLCILDEAGREYQPSGEVRCSVVPAGAESQGETLPAVTHFSPEGPEALDVEPEGQGFGFDTDGFSLYAFAFTVDFTYEGYEYHLPGGSSLKLSRLLQSLSIPVDAPQVQQVTFSDPALVQVERVSRDWLLTSLAPFDTEETLTLTLEQGDVYRITVRDAKGYAFTFNANDSAAGYVYAVSTNYGEEIDLAVTDGGASSGTVRPRSAGNPTNGRYSASDGYRFHFWRRDGYEYYGTGTLEPAIYSDLYAIRPVVGENGVADRATTFTACFAPEGEYIITFDRYIGADPEDGRVYGSVSSGGEKRYTYTDVDGTSQQVCFCYSGNSYGMVAVPGENGVFTGWYISGTDELVCASLTFFPPEGLDRDITVQARFRQARPLTVTYSSYDTQSPTSYRGNITLTGQDTSAPLVSEQLSEGKTPSGARAGDYTGYTFVCWRGPDNRATATGTTSRATPWPPTGRRSTRSTPTCAPTPPTASQPTPRAALPAASWSWSCPSPATSSSSGASASGTRSRSPTIRAAGCRSTAPPSPRSSSPQITTTCAGMC